MDWVLVFQLITATPTGTQAYSNTVVNFQTEQLCTDAVAAMREGLEKTTGEAKVTLNAACLLRKDGKPR